LSGSDGLVMRDIDLDGFQDIVSVHESDTRHDGPVGGHIRIAFGSRDPNQWELVTLARGSEAGAAEDAAIADVNGDGFPDIVAACELEHLIYFQNPGNDVRSGRWERVIPAGTSNRGSFIRAFLADFDGDGRPELVSPNKGSQHPGLHTSLLHPISWFQISGDPLDSTSWIEHELIRVDIPENSRPVDLDGDGDQDILGASRGEERLMWFENLGETPISFKTHPIIIQKDGSFYPVTGVNVDFADLSGDGRLDIVVFKSPRKSNFGWIEQPPNPGDPWKFNPIGTIFPDRLIGVVIADINGDGDPDVMTGGYSSSPRDRDSKKSIDDVLGRLAWFEHPGNAYDPWIRHDISRRVRGMFDKFIPVDLDQDGDLDMVSTRGNSYPYDGVFWLEQVRTQSPARRFTPARKAESKEVGLPLSKRN
ncbi:MAG: VCBS repeat-containing protein, partial [Bacteroidales bacterium]|nr:VCBS repeat-containing protein [Bacteroidales bacterium]